MKRVVMVTGSRGWTDYASIEEVLAAAVIQGDTLIQGGARGADKHAREWALLHSIPCETYAPDRLIPSPQRYHERNDAMLKRADVVLAFWDGQSPGTRSVIEKAQAAGIPVEIVGMR